MVNELESKWAHWNVNDTVQWFFEYVLSTRYESHVVNDSDYEIEDLSDSDSDDDESENSNDGAARGDNEDDEKSNLNIHNVNDFNLKTVDYKLISKQLLSIGFRSKKNLPLIQESFQFRQYGFENKKDRQILCEKTKQLLKKYPKQESKKKKNVKEIAKEQKHEDVEGNVEDTCW